MDYLEIPGWCTSELGDLLNTYVSQVPKGHVYLEIGTFCGRSLIAALQGNETSAFVIDPMELVTHKGSIYELWHKNVEPFKERITLWMGSSAKFDGDIPPVSVFFYDGNHDSGWTYESLCRYEKFLADRAIIIVDDYLIYGGDKQVPYDGHAVDVIRPVQTDVDRWVVENASKIKSVDYTSFGNGQAVIKYGV